MRWATLHTMDFILFTVLPFYKSFELVSPWLHGMALQLRVAFVYIHQVTMTTYFRAVVVVAVEIRINRNFDI